LDDITMLFLSLTDKELVNIIEYYF